MLSDHIYITLSAAMYNYFVIQISESGCKRHVQYFAAYNTHLLYLYKGSYNDPDSCLVRVMKETHSYSRKILHPGEQPVEANLLPCLCSYYLQIV